MSTPDYSKYSQFDPIPESLLDNLAREGATLFAFNSQGTFDVLVLRGVRNPTIEEDDDDYGDIDNDDDVWSLNLKARRTFYDLRPKRLLRIKQRLAQLGQPDLLIDCHNPAPQDHKGRPPSCSELRVAGKGTPAEIAEAKRKMEDISTPKGTPAEIAEAKRKMEDISTGVPIVQEGSPAEMAELKRKYEGWNAGPSRNKPFRDYEGWNAAPPWNRPFTDYEGWNAAPPRNRPFTDYEGWNAAPPRNRPFTDYEGWNAATSRTKPYRDQPVPLLFNCYVSPVSHPHLEK